MVNVRLTPVRAGLIAAIITTVVYSPALWHGFEWDDGYLIKDNQAIRSLSNLPQFFTKPWSAGTSYTTGARQNRPYWRPLAETSFAIDYALGHGRAWVFHLDSILWHAAMVFLLALLAVRLGLSPLSALALAVLFGLHPVHTEAVNVICYRTTLMAGLFGFWALYIHLRPGEYGTGRGILAAVLLLLGLLSKETAGAFVLIIPALDIIMHRLSKRVLLRGYLPGVILVAAYGIAHLTVSSHGMYDFFAGMSTGTKALTGLKIFYRYVRLVLIPWPLTPFYDWWILGIPRSVADPEVIAGIILLLAFVLGLVLSARRARILFIGLVIFLLGLFPVSHVVPFFDAMAERFLYIPLAGALLVLVAGMRRIALRMDARGVVNVLAVLLAVVFGGLTALRTTQWGSSETILQQEIRYFPQSMGARLGLAELYVRTKRYKAAASVVEPVTRHAPHLQVGWAWLAVARAMMGNYQGARRALRHAPAPASGEQTAVMLARSILLSMHHLNTAQRIGI